MNASLSKLSKPSHPVESVDELKAKYEDRIVALEAALRAANVRVALAEAKMRNAEAAAQEQLELFQSSTSWRVTAPLRALMHGGLNVRTRIKPALAQMARRAHGYVMRHSWLRALFRWVLKQHSIRRLLDRTYQALGITGDTPSPRTSTVQAARMGPRARAIHEQLLSLINNKELH